jgi:ketosteroid isomerase-like protein
VETLVRFRLILKVLFPILALSCDRPAGEPAALDRTPQQTVDELLAADRAFSAASADTDVITGISAMFSDSVVMPLPGEGFAIGKAAAIEALRGNPANAASRVEWTPVRGGISADGLHGFTFGYVVTQQPDSAPIPGKYLAYWIKEPAGWRVAVYKRARRPEGAVSEDLLPAALPDHLTAETRDSAVLAQHRASLDSIERAFSDEAQRIGLGAAFAKYGSSDAVNMGGPDAVQWVMGADSIGSNIGRGGPTDSSPVSWGPDRVLVASSGDLGVTIGMIRPNSPPAAGQPAGFPFFTIWRRAGPGAPWRYVAE